MAHDLLKLGLALAALVVIAGVVATLVSGYLTAYNTGNKSVQVPQPAITGGKSVRSMTSPTPGPSMAPPQYPKNQPFIMPETPSAPMEYGQMPQVEMPEQQPPAASLPSNATAPPALTSPSAPSMTIWNYIIQDLLKLFPGLFTGIQRAFPQWPVGWFRL